MPLQNAVVVMLLLGELKHRHMQGHVRCHIIYLQEGGSPALWAV